MPPLQLIPEGGFQGNPTDHNGKAARLLTRPSCTSKPSAKASSERGHIAVRFVEPRCRRPNTQGPRKDVGMSTNLLHESRRPHSCLQMHPLVGGEQPKRAREPNSNRTPIPGLQRSGDNRNDRAREPSHPPGPETTVHMSPNTGS
jgi:hypothetical protein